MVRSDDDYLKALAKCEALAARADAPEARRAIRALADAMALWEQALGEAGSPGRKPPREASRARARAGASMSRILAIARHAHAAATSDDGHGFESGDALA